MREEKFDLKDITLVPAVVSTIKSRKDCNTTGNIHQCCLPLITSPMDTVISKNNVKSFILNGIVPCLSRGDKYECIFEPYVFHSFGLQEIEEQLMLKGTDNKHFSMFSNVLIDVANGHLERLVKVVKRIKEDYPDIKLMVGNVGHPLTYKNLAMAGADYVRCSIGTGAGCTTAANVAINYPIGSLIYECRKIKEESCLTTKIIADGGMKGYDDIIKALALGADAVMIGSILNKAIESAGFNYLWGMRVPQRLAQLLWRWGFPIKKKYRGMSTKSVQRKWGKAELVTAEGITKYQRVEYDITQWTLNFKDYLKSCMSYCDARNLNEFIGKADWIFITNNALRRFEK